MTNTIVVSLSYHYIVSLHLGFLLGQFLQVHFDAANETDILNVMNLFAQKLFIVLNIICNNNDNNNETGHGT